MNLQRTLTVFVLILRIARNSTLYFENGIPVPTSIALLLTRISERRSIRVETALLRIPPFPRLKSSMPIYAFVPRSSRVLTPHPKLVLTLVLNVLFRGPPLPRTTNPVLFRQFTLRRGMTAVKPLRLLLATPPTLPLRKGRGTLRTTGC